MAFQSVIAREIPPPAIASSASTTFKRRRLSPDHSRSARQRDFILAPPIRVPTFGRKLRRQKRNDRSSNDVWPPLCLADACRIEALRGDRRRCAAKFKVCGILDLIPFIFSSQSAAFRIICSSPPRGGRPAAPLVLYCDRAGDISEYRSHPTTLVLTNLPIPRRGDSGRERVASRGRALRLMGLGMAF